MIPTENLRFRDESLTFKIAETADDINYSKTRKFSYPSMTKTMGSGGFKLHVKAGKFTDSEIIVMLGENGTGKTTLVKLLAGKEIPDDESKEQKLKVSMKPQMLSPYVLVFHLFLCSAPSLKKLLTFSSESSLALQKVRGNRPNAYDQANQGSVVRWLSSPRILP
jgi:translation initiation factor RLI1